MADSEFWKGAFGGRRVKEVTREIVKKCKKVTAPSPPWFAAFSRKDCINFEGSRGRGSHRRRRPHEEHFDFMQNGPGARRDGCSCSAEAPNNFASYFALPSLPPSLVTASCHAG